MNTAPRQMRWPLAFLLILGLTVALPMALPGMALAQADPEPAPPASSADSDVELANPSESGDPGAPTEPAEAEADNETDNVAATEAGDDTVAELEANPEAGDEDFQKLVDKQFGVVNGYLIPVLFFDASFGIFKEAKVDDEGQPVLDDDGKPVLAGPEIPAIVFFLLIGGVFFTLRYGFIQIRMFTHSIAVLRGKYDDPHDHGEISHFQALTSALSATVGLGNIAGVAVAISMGGPGAVFWMWVTALLGMATKFTSCTLAQMYRKVSEEDAKTHSEHVLGGPMIYLAEGVKEQLGGGTLAAIFAKFLAISFAVFTIFGALGGGNMFQGNQTFAIVSDVMMDGSRDHAWVGGLILTLLVAVVVVGGIKRIGDLTSKMIPAMCLFYCFICLIIVGSNFGRVPELLASIVKSAFTIEAAAWGGIVAVFVAGVKRAAFSNEAGLGSAAIAHSAARTNEPVREGIVAMIGPFIDTIIVCTMTALAILITDAHINPATGEPHINPQGIPITTQAFVSLAPWLKYMLTLAVFVFAYSTMISWSYYGERASEYLFGRSGIWPFRAIFLFFVFLGPLVSLSNLITFTDLLILSMAYPNILGMLILSGKVAAAASDYRRRLLKGEMKPYDPDAEPVEAAESSEPAEPIEPAEEAKPE